MTSISSEHVISVLKLIFEIYTFVYVLYYFYSIIRVFKKLLVPAYQEVDVLFSNGQYQTTKDKIILMLDLTRFELMKLFSLFLQASLEKMKFVITIVNYFSYEIELLMGY